MQKEELLLKKRFIELSKTAYQRNVITYTDFLNLNELNILHTIPKQEFCANFETFGGYEFSERQMVSFLPDALCYDKQYPISILKIEPIQKKFAEPLNHRDYLGAILNLGIERSKIGDILVEDCCAFVFIHTSFVDYVKNKLDRIRHTNIRVNELANIDFDYQPRTKEVRGTVSSLRLDCLLALAFNESRSKLVAYIEGGKVFVNGKLVTSNGYQLKENDIISVRGFGRFRYKEFISNTKKNRLYVAIDLYV